MISNNFILIIIIVMFIYNEIDKNNKFKNIKKEKFSESTSSSNIDMVSLNLSTLATNIISNNGQTLNLNFSGIHILPFRGMVSPFNIEYKEEELTRLAKSFWYPCDGKDNRPNLINRFIYGGQNVGNTGGAETVTLTTEQLPSHKHKAIIHTNGWHAHESGRKWKQVYCRRRPRIWRRINRRR